MLMRMAEQFSGCRVLAYCVMSNHVQLLLEVPPGEVKRKGMAKAAAERELAELESGRWDARISQVIRRRVRYFSDGAVIGGRGFVEEVFRGCREFFGAKRNNGARKPRGALGPLAGVVWSARDLRVGTG